MRNPSNKETLSSNVTQCDKRKKEEKDFPPSEAGEYYSGEFIMSANRATI